MKRINFQVPNNEPLAGRISTCVDLVELTDFLETIPESVYRGFTVKIDQTPGLVEFVPATRLNDKYDSLRHLLLHLERKGLNIIWKDYQTNVDYKIDKDGFVLDLDK